MRRVAEMNRIHINGKGVNLDLVTRDNDIKRSDGLGRLYLYFGNDAEVWFDKVEREALLAWLNVPNHMAGIIDPLEFNMSALRSMFLINPDATETEA
jgi:hypothetical protein